MVRAQRDSVRLLQGALVAAVVFPLILFGFAGIISYNSIQELTDREIDRSTDVINEHALKVFESVQRTIAEVNEATRDLSDGDLVAREAEFHARLARLADESSEIKSIWIFDRHGKALVNSLSLPAGETIFADRDYFKAHVEKDIGTYVGTVLRPRPPFGGAPFFGISRRRLASGGQFNGVIQISVLPEYFETFYERLAREPGEYASLIRDDGWILARYPKLARDAQLAQQGPLYRSMMSSPRFGHVTLVSAIDGTGRKVAYRKLPNLPVFVLSGLETSAIKGRWLSQMMSHLVYGIPATLALVGIIALALRRTKRLYAEAAGRQAAEDALRQSQRLEALGQLTGGVAHDFNNLLMVIAGGADRAKRKAKDADVESALSMITAAVQKGQTLTRRLLAFSRRQTLSPKPIDLGQTISDFSEVLRQSVRGDIEFQYHAPPRPIFVEADPDELEIALLNLVLNARDAMTSAGTIRIGIEERENTPPGISRHCAAVCVTDTGSGIAADVLPHIFEPYFTTKSTKGTGLGLSQVYGFAQQSGGTVTVDSEMGKGSTFCLWLPKTDKRPQPDAGEVADGARVSSSAKTGRVLLVEDNADVATVAMDYLEQCGWSVVKADNAEVAMEILKSSADVDVIVSDIVMPGMGGLALGRWVRMHHPAMPVILATGYSDQASAALKDGFSLLAKPYTLAALQDELAKHGSKPAARH
ncbi:MAG: response regulator [Pseudolabrys sp.]|nr:response regulator [Pseudolabrys sp.]